MFHRWKGGGRTPRLVVPPRGVAGRTVLFKGRAPPPRGRQAGAVLQRRPRRAGPRGLRERCAAEEPGGGGGGGAEPGRGGR